MRLLEKWWTGALLSVKCCEKKSWKSHAIWTSLFEDEEAEEERKHSGHLVTFRFSILVMLFHTTGHDVSHEFFFCIAIYCVSTQSLDTFRVYQLYDIYWILYLVPHFQRVGGDYWEQLAAEEVVPWIHPWLETLVTLKLFLWDTWKENNTELHWGSTWDLETLISARPSTIRWLLPILCGSSSSSKLVDIQT